VENQQTQNTTTEKVTALQEPRCTMSQSYQFKCDICVLRGTCPLSQLSNAGRR